MFGGNFTLVATRDVLSFASVSSGSFPAESTCVSSCRHSVNCAVVVAQQSVYSARVVWHTRCLFSFPLLTCQLILCTRLGVPDSRHGMHHGSRNSHVSILFRKVAEPVFV